MLCVATHVAAPHLMSRLKTQNTPHPLPLCPLRSQTTTRFSENMCRAKFDAFADHHLNPDTVDLTSWSDVEQHSNVVFDHF